LDNAIQGVEYAIASGSDIINMSFGSYGYSQAHKILFDYAMNNGITCVGASGNDFLQAISFPAGYSSVISVGASDATNDHTNFSNWSTVIDVYAPGLNIWSPVGTGINDYEFLSGTSMSSPLVSGLCALMLANDPTHTANSIRQCLINSASQFQSNLTGQQIGIINAAQSVNCIPPITNVCDAPCNLVYNGAFEVPENSGILSYPTASGIADGSVCSWESYIQTSDIFPTNEMGANHFSSSIGAYKTGWWPVWEGVVSNPMKLVPGEMYRVEFDYVVCNRPLLSFPAISQELDTMVIALINNQYDWYTMQGDSNSLDTTRLNVYLNVPVDYVNDNPSWLSFDTVDFNGLSHHVIFEFQASSDTSRRRLLIHPSEATHEEKNMLQLDNISVKRILDDIVITATDTTIIQGNCTGLNVNGSASIFNWEPQGFFTNPWSQSQTVCPDSTTTYYLNFADTSMNCFQTDSITIYVVDDTLNLENLDFEFAIFPNPSKDVFTIYSDLVFEKIEVRDLLGKLVTSDYSNKKINLSTYPDGAYFVNFSLDSGVITRKLLKVHY